MGDLLKKDLIAEIHKDIGYELELSREQVAVMFDSTLNCIKESLIKGDDVIVRNFGAFRIVEAKEKVGRNPQKPKKSIKIPAHNAVKFKPSEKLKEQIKNK